MSSPNKRSLLNRARVSRLGKGIHNDVVITNIDIADRKNKGVLIKKMLYITFAKLDENNKRVKEIELSWFRLDHTSDYMFSNLRELAIQLSGILTCYMTDDEAFTAMGDEIEGINFTSVDEMEQHKWKKAEVDAIATNLLSNFKKVMTDKVGINSNRMRLKITTDNKGSGENIPSFGVFTEPMTVEEKDSRLKFTDVELKNHSKGGNVSVMNGQKADISNI